MIGERGYIHIYSPGHHRANQRGYVREHLMIAEEALGKKLPDGAEVHHVDENPSNNARNNLVICQDHGYHMLLHYRLRIVRAGGSPEIHKICSTCRLVVARNLFEKSNSGDGLRPECRECKRKSAEKYRLRHNCEIKLRARLKRRKTAGMNDADAARSAVHPKIIKSAEQAKLAAGARWQEVKP